MSAPWTPLPWRPSPKTSDAIVADPRPGEPHAEYYGGRLVAESMNPSDREFILKACNNHSQLMALVSAAVQWGAGPGWADKAKSVLAAVRGDRPAPEGALE